MIRNLDSHRPLAWAKSPRLVLSVVGFVAIACVCAAASDARADDYYTGEQVYNGRPNPTRGKKFGHIGATGIEAFIHEGVQVTAEVIDKAGPAAGKVREGDVILAVNGTELRGRNPFVVLGRALTEAEATDGKLVFDLRNGETRRRATVTIPVLGRYSDTWPVDCAKSTKIVDRASAYYHAALSAKRGHDIEGALMCLFLLSTGDDAHLPVVGRYFAQFLDNPAGVGDNTWNNGYNGIACGEYYLRTGDKAVLPLLRYYCDDAKRRQKFGVAWGHWGNEVNPGYVAGGLMNPASAQVLTTLLLAKECGVDVDDRTLLGALKFFYRFVGHGTVPYGDHRGEGGLGSNGKDGMIAAAMQVAAGATGDTSIYQSARDCLSMSTLKSYPSLATGHGDDGRGDGLWRGLAAAYLIDKKPAEYRAMMDRLAWWYDLSRFGDGSMGMASLGAWDKPGSGAGVLLAYTAPRKRLRITGAPRSKYAVDFTLPEKLWGRPADLAFHSIEHNPKFAGFGEELPPHRLLNLMGHAYRQTDPKQTGVTRERMLQNVYHHRYVFRAQAAKSLVRAGELGAIEGMLTDADPRVRRAALDGLIDWRYWFATGRERVKPESYTPKMIDAIVGMITNPDEAWYVVEGALFAMHDMPAEVIDRHVDAIMPWTTHAEWWLRQASFMALQGLAKDDRLYAKVLPTVVGVFVNEYHTQPREWMNNELVRVVRQKGADSPAGKAIVAGFARAAAESEIKPADRASEGAYNVMQSVKRTLEFAPDTAATAAAIVRDRFDRINTGTLLRLLARGGDGRSGLLPVLAQLEGEPKRALAKVLYDDYRPELTRRLKADKGVNLELIDTVLALKQIEEDVTGWQVIGTPAAAERVWRFTSLDATVEDEKMHPRERKRFRDITLPDRFDGWFKPGFDDSGWQSGRAPIGKGDFRQRNKHFDNRSTWGDGEFLLARTTFEVDSLDHDLYRLSVLANQGFCVYLNGHKVHTYIWWKDDPHYRKINLDAEHVRHLTKGTNTLAVYANAEYPLAMNPRRWKQPVQAQLDCRIEGLKKSDLY